MNAPYGIFMLKRVVLATLASAAAGFCSAADFPTKPVTLIAPTAPGGAVDGSARLIADRLAERLGQRVIVENRPGANGTIGAALAARAAPDGHTLLFTQNTPLVVAPHTIASLPYDVFGDFAAVTKIGSIQLVLVANPSLKAASVPGFIRLAKASPGKIAYASGGEGSDHHLAMELLRLSTGIRLHHVPYKAGPQGFADLLGGHVGLMFIASGTAARHVSGGKLQALGVSGTKPISAYPGVPTIGSVVPGYEYESWFALLAPKGTPRGVIGRLNAEFGRVIALPEIGQKLGAIGIEADAGSPEEMASLMKKDYEKLGNLIRQIGMSKR